MSLYPFKWKFLPPYTVPIVSQSRIDGILDGIYATFASPTYADGTSRTSGSGVAWSFNRTSSVDSGSVRGVTAAVWCYPATMSILSQSVMFMGTASAPTVTPLMATNATFAASGLYVAVQKYANPFQYRLFNSASLFNSGSSGTSLISSSGFAPIIQTFTNVGTIHAWECQEAIAFQVVETSSFGGGTYCGLAGAFIDPESTDTLSDAFSDGRIYGVATTGTTSSVTFLNLTNDFLNHNAASVNSSKFAYLQPPTSSLTCSVRTLSLIDQRNLDFRFVASSSKVPMLNQYTKDSGSGNFIGRLREIKAIRSFQSALTYRSSSIDIGYTLAARNSGSATTGSCILLMA